MQQPKPLPRYKCHKEVRALRILRIHLKGDGAVLYPAEEGYQPFEVNSEYLTKHRPYAGGYFVEYDDGYISFSPAKVFEDGYTLMEESDATNPGRKQ